MKQKLVIVTIVIVAIVLLLNLIENKTVTDEDEVDADVEIDISTIQSEIYLNKTKISDAIRDYLAKQNIQCKTATALEYRYEDLETADIVYDIYFLLDDEDNTLLTMCYEPAENSPQIKISIAPCEYTYDEILSQIWYREDYQ